MSADPRRLAEELHERAATLAAWGQGLQAQASGAIQEDMLAAALATLQAAKRTAQLAERLDEEAANAALPD